MLNAITNRRSIRKYKSDEVPESLVGEIIKAGLLAPSSKNRQPWKFIVVTGRSKEEMLEVFQKGIEREKRNPLLPESAQYISGAEYTLEIMRQAPVTIFIVNLLEEDITQTLTTEERVSEICNAQSIGAAIENMTLAATELGLGSLWICDTYFAHEELNQWLHGNGELCGELFAALTIGYADEAPKARPRKSMEDAVEWRR